METWKSPSCKGKSSSIHLHYCVQNVNFPGCTTVVGGFNPSGKKLVKLDHLHTLGQKDKKKLKRPPRVYWTKTKKCQHMGVSSNGGTPKTPQNDYFGRKTRGCWVPPFRKPAYRSIDLSDATELHSSLRSSTYQGDTQLSRWKPGRNLPQIFMYLYI